MVKQKCFQTCLYISLVWDNVVITKKNDFELFIRFSSSYAVLFGMSIMTVAQKLTAIVRYGRTYKYKLFIFFFIQIFLMHVFFDAETESEINFVRTKKNNDNVNFISMRVWLPLPTLLMLGKKEIAPYCYFTNLSQPNQEFTYFPYFTFFPLYYVYFPITWKQRASESNELPIRFQHWIIPIVKK